jgi:hypothetical protein
MFVPAPRDAVIEHMPAVTKTILRPDVVQTPVVVEFNVTGSPELAVAPDAKGLALNGCVPGSLNVMVCGADAIVIVTFCVAFGVMPFIAVTVNI